MKLNLYIEAAYQSFLSGKARSLQAYLLRILKLPFLLTKAFLAPPKKWMSSSGLFLLLALGIGSGLVNDLLGGGRYIRIDRVNVFSTVLDLMLVVLEMFVQGVVGLFLISLPLSVLMCLDPVFSPDSRFLRKIRKEMKFASESYTKNNYEEAAQILRKIKPRSYKKQCELYSKKQVDLLLCINAVYPMKGLIKRIVSLKAIEEDREAQYQARVSINEINVLDYQQNAENILEK
jgi:hypothetical protein